MNRDLSATAAVLGIGPRKLRTRLRELGILNHQGALRPEHERRGYLYTDTRARWNPAIGTYSHYGVVMVTERGVGWLAKALDVPITRPEDAA